MNRVMLKNQAKNKNPVQILQYAKQLPAQFNELKERTFRHIMADGKVAALIDNNKIDQVENQISISLNVVARAVRANIDDNIFSRIVEELKYDIVGSGPIEPLLLDDDITDIMVNGTNGVFVEKKGKVYQTNIKFKSNAALLAVCKRIATKVGRVVDESHPMCDTRLLDGSRVNIIISPLSLIGPILTIRKFKKDALTIRDLINFGTTNKTIAHLLSIIGKSRCNVMISGGTGSGKTTLLNVMSSFINNDERIITCEDTAELVLQQKHVVKLETRPPSVEGTGEVNMRDLVKNCLRMRPERIIVGEVRGGEAFDLLQAMNTGHSGSMGTIHSNSPRDCVMRMESLVMMAGLNIPQSIIRDMVVSAIDVIIQVSRMRDGTRRITKVTEVVGCESGVVTLQDLAEFKEKANLNSKKVEGGFIVYPIKRPKMYNNLIISGLAPDYERYLRTIVTKKQAV